MERPTPLAILALLVATMLVVPAAAGPTVTTDPATDARAASVSPVAAATIPSPTNNTTARVVVPSFSVRRAEFATVNIGVGSTLQQGTEDARLEHQHIVVRQAFENASTTDRRRSVIDRALIDLSERAAALEARERASLRAYSDGAISAAVLVRRLARIDAQARRIDEMARMVRTFTDRIGTRDFDTRIRDVRGTVATLRGPVRNRVGLALAGERPPLRVNVVAAPETMVLSTLVGGSYVREATDWTNRNASAPPTLGLTDASRRAAELYPWASEQPGTSVDGQGAGAWRFVASHPQGELTASIDASTADVYHETQRLSVAEMPTTMTLVHTEAGIRVSLERTYLGGPLRVLVEDAANFAAIDARVRLDGYDLGNVGADGLAVVIEPRPPYTVNVTADGETVSFTVERPLGEG